MSADYPWRDGRSVAEVIETNRKLLTRIGMIERGGGYSAAEIRTIERHLGQEIPTDVKELYAAARPKNPTSEQFPSIALFEPDSEEDVRWYRLLKDAPHPINLFKDGKPVGQEDFKNAEGLMLGGTPFFDRLFWVRGHARLPDGCLMLTNHEDVYPLPIVARSLAEYLSRICAFGGVELVSCPGEREDLSLDQVLQFAQEFVELNPQESEWGEWAARAAMRKEHPFGHPLGYHHWDEARKRLVPIREAGQVSKITVEHPTPADIESIADAGRCRHLMLINAPKLDLTPLARLRTLGELYVYDVSEVDAAPLAQSPSLQDLCFLRCRVQDLAALVDSSSLKRLRIHECRFIERELEAVRRGRRGIKIERWPAGRSGSRGRAP